MNKKLLWEIAPVCMYIGESTINIHGGKIKDKILHGNNKYARYLRPLNWFLRVAT